MSVGERSKIRMLGAGWPHGHVLLYFLQGVKFSIGADTYFTIQESSAVSFTKGQVSIGDQVSIYMSKSSVFAVQRADDQPSLFVLKGAVLSFGLNSWLLVDNGCLYTGTNSRFSTGKNSDVYVGPGTFHLGPGSKVEISERSSIKVYGKPRVDSLVLHDNAALGISIDATLIVGNSSVLAVLPSKTLSLGERSKLSMGDHVYCLVTTDVAIAEYTKVEIDFGRENPMGFTCVPTSHISDDIRQFKARHGIA